MSSEAISHIPRVSATASSFVETINKYTSMFSICPSFLRGYFAGTARSVYYQVWKMYQFRIRTLRPWWFKVSEQEQEVAGYKYEEPGGSGVQVIIYTVFINLVTMVTELASLLVVVTEPTQQCGTDRIVPCKESPLRPYLPRSHRCITGYISPYSPPCFFIALAWLQVCYLPILSWREGISYKRDKCGCLRVTQLPNT